MHGKHLFAQAAGGYTGIVTRFLSPLLFAVLAIAVPNVAAAQDLADFEQEISESAARAGVSQQTIDASLRGFQPNQHVIELDRRQPEKTQTFDQYFAHTATDSRVAKGQDQLARNRPLLERIESDYGVAPAVLVALWGMESSYGSVMGDSPTIHSLATLSYEGRRHEFFKSELIKAMQIVDAGDVTVQGMVGSWAGAMGQVQFMPSTFQNYAVDYDGAGRRDIWHDNADALASAANYLSQSGWHRGELWGREVTLPGNFSSTLIGLDKPRPLDDWKRLGVLRTDGTELPEADIDAALVLPDGPNGRAFLAYNNYRVIMRWNHSTYFATSVGLISDAIEGRE